MSGDEPKANHVARWGKGSVRIPARALSFQLLAEKKKGPKMGIRK